MDLKKLLGDSGPLRSAVEAQREIDSLNKFGAVDWEEIDRRNRERQDQELFERGRENAQRMHRQLAEAQAREEQKTDYLRRSAEASEEVLAEERRKRDAAELAAKQAKADRDIAEERARRAEARERRMERLMVLSLIGMVAALAVAAWPFVKESMGL